MKRSILMIGLITVVTFSAGVSATTLIANNVDAGAKQTLLTVAPKKKFKLLSLSISAEACGAIDRPYYKQRIYKSGIPITSNLSTGHAGSYYLMFNPPIVFNAGDTLEVENGNDECTTSWFIQGR